jgi:hypothetical protein
MREWRKATWALVGWTVLSPCGRRQPPEVISAAPAKRAPLRLRRGATIGLSLGVTFVVIVWLIGFIILGRSG